MLSSKDTVSIIVHILIIAVFITIFFFTYGSYIEKQIVKKQLEYIVNDLAGDIKVIAPEIVPVLQKQLGSVGYPNLEKEDKIVEENNKKLKNKTIGTVIGLTVVTLVVIYYLIQHYELDAKDIMMTNLISCTAVAFTYFIFTTYIIANYRSADPNFVKKTFVQALVDYGKDTH